MRLPSGASTPLLCATRALPYAMALVAKSSRMVGSPTRGKATQNGFVLKRASLPPNGATMRLPPTLTKWMLMSPAAAHCSAQ